MNPATITTAATIPAIPHAPTTEVKGFFTFMAFCQVLAFLPSLWLSAKFIIHVVCSFLPSSWHFLPCSWHRVGKKCQDETIGNNLSNWSHSVLKPRIQRQCVQCLQVGRLLPTRSQRNLHKTCTKFGRKAMILAEISMVYTQRSMKIRPTTSTSQGQKTTGFPQPHYHTAIMRNDPCNGQ